MVVDGSPATLAFSGAIGVATAGVFATVGRLVAARPTETASGRRALRLFATWWLSLSLLTLAGATQALLAAAGVVALLPHLVLGVLAVLPLTAGLWGLLYYLLYVYTGNERLLAPLTLAYVAILGWFLHLVWWLQPKGVEVGAWGVALDYARDLEGPLLAVVLLVLLGPVLVASALYGSLFFRSRDAAIRYRVGMVSSAFLVWFGSAGLASATGVGDAWWWPLASRVVGLAATLMVLAAYRPPRVVRQRLGAEGVAAPARPSRRGPRLRQAPPADALRG